MREQRARHDRFPIWLERKAPKPFSNQRDDIRCSTKQAPSREEGPHAKLCTGDMADGNGPSGLRGSKSADVGETEHRPASAAPIVQHRSHVGFQVSCRGHVRSVTFAGRSYGLSGQLRVAALSKDRFPIKNSEPARSGRRVPVLGWNMASGPSFTLPQLARALGISPDEVRLYRTSGLLQPPRRRRSRTDDLAFGTEHVERLHFIRQALSYGFLLEDIAKMVGEIGLMTCNDVYRLSVRRLEELRRDRGCNDATVIALGKLIATCAGRGRRTDCQILTTLAKADQQIKGSLSGRLPSQLVGHK